MKGLASSDGRPGFTLVEILVSMSILTIILLVLVSVINLTQHIWSSTSSTIEKFRGARFAFETITRQLSQATLNTYWDYQKDANGIPQRYIRQSELRFVNGPGVLGNASSTPPRPTHAVFFQAPLGFVGDARYENLNSLMNTWGYFIEFGSDARSRPSFVTVPVKYRFRLMEMMEPAESSQSVYAYTSGNPAYSGLDWITGPLALNPPPIHALADNVIALILLPMLTPAEDNTGTKLAPLYKYDSTASAADATVNPKNQLPPVVQVTMVVIDEASAARLASSNGTNAPALGLDQLFQDATRYTADLVGTIGSTSPGLEQTLNNQKIGYRVFTANVSLRAAKWSVVQTN